MKPARLKNDPAAADPVLALCLLEAVGTQEFAARVLAALERDLPASHCTVFALRSSGRVEALSSASGVGEVATLTAVEYMRRGFDKQDSNMLWLARRKPGKARQFWLGHQFAEEVADEEYRRLCYGEPGIRERLSLLSVLPDGSRVAVSLYRNHSYPDFEPRDVEWLGNQAAVLAAAAMRHAELQRRTNPSERLHQQLMSTLSARERELVSHVVAGMTTKEAARLMGVSLTTAITYRYRAFQHLGIRSHRELISLLGAVET
jgi:DNA-binding CsgD family transcriptional regulator